MNRFKRTAGLFALLIISVAVLGACKKSDDEQPDNSQWVPPFDYEMTGLVGWNSWTVGNYHVQVITDGATPGVATPLATAEYVGEANTAYAISIPLDNTWGVVNIFAFIDENSNSTYDTGEPNLKVCSREVHDKHSINLYTLSAFSTANAQACTPMSISFPVATSFTASKSSLSVGEDLTVSVTVGSNVAVTGVDVQFEGPELQTIALTQDGIDPTLWSGTVTVNYQSGKYYLVPVVYSADGSTDYQSYLDVIHRHYMYRMANTDQSIVQNGEINLLDLWLEVQ